MLYIVGTPIGNLEDLSVRQAKIVANVEILLTEDTRSTGILLQKITELFSLKINENQRLISYYKENEFEKLSQIMEWLEEGRKIALISQAGMPIISDPGLLLVKQVIKQSLPLTVIPGPTAATTALIYSGFNPQEHMFLGFLPKRASEVRKTLEKVKQVKQIFKDTTFIFYESPLRAHATLSIIKEVLPDAELSIARELTKKFEEVIRGSVDDLLQRQYKGEVVLLLH